MINYLQPVSVYVLYRMAVCVENLDGGSAQQEMSTGYVQRPISADLQIGRIDDNLTPSSKKRILEYAHIHGICQDLGVLFCAETP